MCLKFIEDIFYFTKRYESVEKFYIEILKKKDKNFLDLKALKAKYEIFDDQPVFKEIEIISRKSPTKLIKSPKKPISVSQISSPLPLESSECSTIEIPETPQTPLKLPQKISKSPEKKISQVPQKSTPKLLNPTILPKIESKLRLELLTCDLCSHTTSTKTSLEKHMEIHIMNKKIFECQICHKKFAKKLILVNHEMTHKSSGDRKTFQCKECGKHLSNKSAVNSHMKWHHSEKEFKCHVCSKDFATVRFERIKINLN